MGFLSFLQRDVTVDASDFLGKDEKTREIREFNGNEIREGISCARAALANVDSNVMLKNGWSSQCDIKIKNKIGVEEDLTLFVQFCLPRPMVSSSPELEIQLKAQNQTLVASRTYTFGGNGDSLTYERYIDVLSSLSVHDHKYEKLGLGMSLLLHGEELKVAVIRKIAPQSGYTYVRSVIRDGSNPPKWTTNAALTIGYKSIGTYGNSPSYAKIDYIDPSLSFWEKKITIPRKISQRG